MRLTNSGYEALCEYHSRLAMAINIFRPMPHQDTVFREQYMIHLIRGGNRAGKSLSCAVRFAATVMDLPITLSDGTQVHCRRPHQRGKNLTCWIIGYDWVHIGLTIYGLLFKGNAFNVAYDEEEGKYRPWRRTDGEEAKIPSNPLIPERYIKPGSWSWENKKLRQFRKVEIWNPETQETIATIYTFPSTAEAKAGDIVDVIWIDEKIEDPDHFDEWKARLTDRRGHLFWSSWPSVENDALRKITEQAEIEKDLPNPTYGEVVLRFSDNTSLSEDIVEQRLASFTSEEERMARDLGEYVTGLTKMYPEFSEYDHDVHCVDDELSRELRKYGDSPPPDWTRELILDPGTAHPAILFCAIPPPKFGDYLVVYAELDYPQADAYKLSAKAYQVGNGYRYNRFIIDDHAARQTPMGMGKTIGRNYKEAFEFNRLTLQSGLVYFTPGCDNVSGRIAELQNALSRAKGIPRLRIVTKACPILCRQLKRYLKKTIKKEVDEYAPAPRQTIDFAVALEYWVSSNPRYVKPKDRSRPVEDMDAWEFDELFFHGEHHNRKPSKGVQLGPDYLVR